MKSKDRKYRIPASVLWREEKDQVVLFNEESGEPYLLNDIGTSIWKQCDQGKKCGEIVSAMLGAYAGNSDQISRETKKFLADLKNEGFLEEVKHDA